MTIKAKTLLRELKSLEGSMTQPWNRRVLGDAIKFVEDSMKGPAEQGWDALARINADRLKVEPPVAPVPHTCSRCGTTELPLHDALCFDCRD